MPINYKEYHKDWKVISSGLREKADNKCELCEAENGQPHWKTKSKVVLTVHHIDADRENNTKQNLIVLCQRCHLRLDLGRHMRNRRYGRNNPKLDI